MRRGSRELRLSLSADSFRSKRTHDASLTGPPVNPV